MLDADALANFLANHALAQHLVLHVVLEILERHARLLFHPFVKFVGIGNIRLFLNRGHALGQLRVNVDREVLGFLDQQQIVDAILQQVFRFRGHLFV